MSEDELQSIVNAVLSAIKTNSLTIEQLTLVESLPDNSYFEISGGRKISSSTIKAIVADYVNEETQSIRVNIADLYKKVSEYNVSVLYPSNGVDGSDKYTLVLAVSVLNEHLLDNYKRDWVRIIYKDEYNKTIGYIFKGGEFGDASNWELIIAQEIGDSKITPISQDAVTKLFVMKDSKQAIGLITVPNEVEINTVLEAYNHPRHVGLYNLCDKSGNPWAILEITSDSMMHVVNQCIKGNLIIKKGVIIGHQDNLVTEIQRTYNFSAPNLGIPVRTWGTWQYCHTRYLKSEFGDSEEYSVTQKIFTDQTKDRVIGIVDIEAIDTLNNLQSLGHYHVYANGRPMHEMVVTSDNMYHTIIQYMFSNYTAEGGELKTHQDNIATIVYRIYNLDRPAMTEIPQGTWGKWKQYGQNYDVLSESEYENLKRKNSEVFYYTYEDEEEV